ncbi:MAG: hypothetical protein K8T89_13730 [Planctomycetes bacterium]|nr:hypothetical protein [Planctomycetota bacterium]
MKAARLRLIVAATLFVGWLFYLGYLALGHGKAVVVSRSQLLQTVSAVKAEVTLNSAGKPNSRVEIRETIAGSPLDAGEIEIENMGEAKLPGGKPLQVGGTFVLLLENSRVGKFRIAAPSTGQGPDSSSKLFLVYPWSQEVDGQVRKQLAPP